MKLTDFKALTFDCYGTLIDWETGMMEGLGDLVRRAGRELERGEILQAHARHESAHQKWTPARRYEELLQTVYRRLAEEWGVSVTRAECEAYGRSVRSWPAFADCRDALGYLKRHYRLVILSNVDNDSFAASNEKLGVEFDAVYTAEDIGSYKPADRNFEYMLENLGAMGVAKADILHTAESMFHDHGPANRFGLASCWIYRRHGEGGFGATMTPADMPKYDFRFDSLAAMVGAHREALRDG